MSAFDAVDLSRLPPPQSVEALSVQELLREMRLAARTIAPELAEGLALESDPAVKVLELTAWREVVVRNLANRRTEANMLAFARGADLDNLGANNGVGRLVLVPADPDATPPAPAVMEADDDFRRRIQLSFEGFTTAGSRGAYVFHALTADPRAKDAWALGHDPADPTSPDPGQVRVTILSREDGDGTASGDLLGIETDYLSADTRRPITDTVIVQSAAIAAYAVDATLEIASGPDRAVIVDRARTTIAGLVEDSHRLGRLVSRTALIAAATVTGVRRVYLASPAADVDPGPEGAPWCTGITVVAA